jgi:hypothetical protein
LPSGDLWDNVAEHEVDFGNNCNKRMDPVLKLYQGLRILLTQNKDVAGGIANGTQATIIRIVLKKNETYGSTTITDERQVLKTVKAVLAHQIDHIELQHENNRIQPAIFRLKPEDFSFKAKLPHPLDVDKKKTNYVNLKATQLPIISNDATTGHKLQGCSVENLFVHEWAQQCKNWIYVVLSRVRTKMGLFSRDKIPSDPSLYAVPQDLQNLMEALKNKRPNSFEVRHTFIDHQH